jgi:hypothetical protein
MSRRDTDMRSRYLGGMSTTDAPTQRYKQPYYELHLDSIHGASVKLVLYQRSDWW